MAMLSGIVQVRLYWAEFSGTAWSIAYWATRKCPAELWFGGEMPQQNQNALEIWTLTAKFVIKAEVLYKLFNVSSAGTACSRVQLPV